MSNRISTSPRADIYQCITDSIVRDLEQVTRPWIRPWITSASATSSTRPLRHDGTPYRGINVLILWSEASARGYGSQTWMTYRQAQSLGAQVRKGELGSRSQTNTVMASSMNRFCHTLYPLNAKTCGGHDNRMSILLDGEAGFCIDKASTGPQPAAAQAGTRLFSR